MSAPKEVLVIGGSGLGRAAMAAAFAEAASTVIPSGLVEKSPKETRKERRTRERMENKAKNKGTSK